MMPAKVGRILFCLRLILKKLMTRWIKECIGSATAFVLVNDSPTREFMLERGLHRKDLLSPFLFLITAEGSSVMMRAVVQSNLFTVTFNKSR
jgi:hypothetical protein